MALVEVKVPDIGDFDEVGVIEVLVKAGDTVKVEQSLITVESDKASMEIPSSHGGVLRELKVKLGDKVSRGSVIAVLEVAAAKIRDQALDFGHQWRFQNRRLRTLYHGFDGYRVMRLDTGNVESEVMSLRLTMQNNTQDNFFMRAVKSSHFVQTSGLAFPP